MKELTQEEKAAKWDELVTACAEIKTSFLAYYREDKEVELAGIKRPPSDCPSYRRWELARMKREEIMDTIDGGRM